MRRVLIVASSLGLMLAACEQKPAAPAEPARPAADSPEGRSLLQLESRLGAGVKLERTRNAAMNGYPLFCGEAVTPDGKRQPFVLVKGFLYLEKDAGKQLMDEMLAECDKPAAAPATAPAPPAAPAPKS
jgi:hypothetical protein